jgi:type I restriction enzyme, S subunit
MNAERFLTSFGHVANAPGGIGALRDLVSHLAFAGELVEHSRGDVAKLIESLALAESSTGRSRRAAPEPPAGYYKIPPHWQWVNIGMVGHDWGQVKPAEDFTYIDVSAIDNKRGIVGDGASVVAATNAPSRARKIVKKGTVIYSTVRPYLLNIAVIERDFKPAPIASTAFVVLHPRDGVEAKYVYYFLRSPAFATYVESVQSGIAYPAISDQKFFAASLPLAPAEEQRRIVAKVDQLMALCDQLEAQQQERERSFPVLSRACHALYAQAPTPANLDRIFDKIGTISPVDLRKTVLQFAVTGRLLGRIASDGDSETLLAQIIQKTHELADAGKIKRSSTFPEIDSSSELPSIPAHWHWTRLGNLTSKIGSGSTPRGGAKVYTMTGIPFLRSQNIWNEGIRLDDVVFIDSRTHEAMRNTHVFPNDILLNITGASLGRCAIVPSGFSPANVSQHVTIIRPLHGQTTHFLRIFLLSPFGQGMIWGRQVGMAREGLSKKVLEQFEIPLPPLKEQKRIVVKVDELMALVDQLETQMQERDKVAEGFAKACVSSFTGTTIHERTEKMKAPKTELISIVAIGKKPGPNADAPLAKLLSEHKGRLAAKALWEQSGLAIDDFYQQLKTEITKGWIAPPTEALMKIVDET